MKAFLNKIRRHGLLLELVNGELKLYSNGKAPEAELLSEIKEKKQEIIDFLSEFEQERINNLVRVVIPRAESKTFYPLSSTQQRLWVLSQFDEGNVAYSLPGVYQLEGTVRPESLKRAFYRLIEKHEILRTVFRQNEMGEVGQMILPPDEVEFNSGFEDISALPDKEATISRLINDEASTPFDLANGPLIRVRLVQTGSDKYLLTCTMHHIVCDAWSMQIILRDIFSFYNEDLNNSGATTLPLEIQYKDYATWQRQQLYTGAFDKNRQFWLTQFSGELPVLDLQGDKPRPSVKTFNGGVYVKELSGKLYQDTCSLARQNNSTLFISLLAALNALLFKYTGQEDIIVGSPVAGRELPQLENQVGPYLNILPLRSKFGGQTSLDELFQLVKRNALAAFENQAYPFDELVDALNLKRDLSRSPMFDVMIIVLNKNDEETTLRHPALTITEYKADRPVTTKYDLTFIFKEKPSTFLLELEYNRDLFDESTIALLAAHYERALDGLIHRPTDLLCNLNLLSVAEQKNVTDFNTTKSDYPTEKTIVDLFTEQAIKTPDKLAATFESQRITFKELDQKSNQLAHYLIERELGSNPVIPVCMERGLNMLIALLGIMKAGGAYVPVDPGYPADRVEFIVANTEAPLVITDKASMSRVTLRNSALLVLDEEQRELGKRSGNSTGWKLKPSDAAYIIYTSGSTGLPKGVMIEHRNLVNFVFGMDKSIDLKQEDHLLALTSLSFDISFLELFYTLCRGIQVTIKPQDKLLTNLNRYGSSGKASMDFSLFYFSSIDNPAKPDKYDLLMRSVDFADKNDFSAVWLPERHFHEFGGIFPNPAILAAALAVTTKKVEIRSGSVVLPLHDTLQVAEEWSVIDNLSGGRVSLSIASGWHADDFVLRPDNFMSRHSIMYDQIDVLKSLWRGASVKRLNGNGNEVSVKAFPRPIQTELPLWITTAGSAETFKSAGRIGAGILTHLLGQEVAELKNNIRVYKEALAASGFPPEKARVALMLHTFIGTELDAVKQEVRQPFKSYLRSSASLLKNLAANSGIGLDDLSEQDYDKLLDLGFDRYWQTSALLGTKESCAKLVNELAFIGVTEVACLIDFGVKDDSVIKSLGNLNELRKEFKSEANFRTEKPVTAIQITPSYLNAIVHDEDSRDFLKSLKHILVGGEALTGGLISKLKDLTEAEIYNMYGPTETTIWSSVKRNPNADAITIGTPIANTQMYVLDKYLNVCPVGVKGELYIGGAGLARGYYKADDLTRQKFVPSPFSSEYGNLIYKTGDVAKRLQNGEIQYLGRNDEQVKINGFRIELGEIEQTLLKHSSVREAAIVVKEKQDGDKYLVAYLTGEHLNPPELRMFLGSMLPQYMVPSFMVVLEHLPMTPNGKTDKKSLMTYHDDSLPDVSEYTAPSGDVENRIADIWSDVLGIGKNKIGIKDSFFDLGGNSLKMIKMLSTLNKVFHKEISLVTAFKLPNISALSDYIKANGSGANENAEEAMDDMVSVMENTLQQFNST